eukprot:2791527-Amphidinium_carterae.1
MTFFASAPTSPPSAQSYMESPDPSPRRNRSHPMTPTQRAESSQINADEKATSGAESSDEK